MNLSLLHLMLVILLAAAGTGRAAPLGREPAPAHKAAKIRFRLNDIRPDGLRGPPDGLTAVAYEFCVPADERVYQEVRRIDPSVRFHPGSRGRIGCGKNQTLCLGETHQPRWRDVLQKLAALAYIAEIRECFFE